ncbi:MAG TPA: hypothetical protein VIR58_20265 [Acidimicrobiales bacterium]
MFVAVVHFPPVPAQRDAAFRAWFAWSNEQLRDSAGLAGRRLLRGADGAYVGLVEHDSAATFAQMHASPAASEVQQQLQGILEGEPHADVYEVVDAVPVAGCCGGTRGDEATAADRTVEVGAAAEGGCCQAS